MTSLVLRVSLLKLPLIAWCPLTMLMGHQGGINRGHITQTSEALCHVPQCLANQNPGIWGQQVQRAEENLEIN